MKHILRDHQIKAVEIIMKSLEQSKHRILLEFATGTGQSVVLVESVNRILQYHPEGRILILTARVEQQHAIDSILHQQKVDFTTKDYNRASVLLTTYSKIQKAVENGSGMFDFQYVLCMNAGEATDAYLQEYLCHAFFIGFTNIIDRVKKGWFDGAECVFRYTLTDAVRDGERRPFNSPMYDVAVEGFCDRLLSQFGIEINKGNEHKFPDIIGRIEDKTIIIECKSYRNRYVQVKTIDAAVAQMQQYAKRKDKNDVLLLILFGEISEDIKKTIFEKFKITIWDITNLIFYTRDNVPLISELSQLSYFPIAEIKPVPPIGWRPEINASIAKVSLSQDNIAIKFEHQLNDCKTGEKHFRDYEQICTNIIQFLFGEEFTITSDQHKTGDKMFRMDLLCSLKGTSAFWELLIHHFNSRFVVFEFKNYAQQLPQNLIFITEKYLFNAALRNVAVIISRKGFANNAKTAAVGCLKENGKLILNITDDDLITMLRHKRDGKEPADYLLEKLERLLMTISK